MEKSINLWYSSETHLPFSLTQIFRAWRILRKPEPRLLVFPKLTVKGKFSTTPFPWAPPLHSHKLVNLHVQHERENPGPGTASLDIQTPREARCFFCSLQVEIWYNFKNLERTFRRICKDIATRRNIADWFVNYLTHKSKAGWKGSHSCGPDGARRARRARSSPQGALFTG